MERSAAHPDKPQRYEDIHFVDTGRAVWNYSLLTDEDIRNFQRGTLYRAYELFGARPAEMLGQNGYAFTVWAPNARAVSVVGDFNQWRPGVHPLFPRLDRSGIWEGFIPGLARGQLYKFHITDQQGQSADKGDPFGYCWELRPGTATRTWDLAYSWNDADWMRGRRLNNSLDAPWSVYEVHLGSWMRPDPGDPGKYNDYRFFADRLVDYVREMGFTHVEFLPVMEHPFDGSWGYQGIGYFAPTSRYGNPQDFMALVDAFHQAGIGVILDWVPSHFPRDAHGLFRFDGVHTYEYADMRKGYHPDWNSYIFNYRRGEVKSFLISGARFWFDLYHVDALRVDAVSSMLKLNYSREEGEWEPNEFGGDGNLEAMAFIRDLNETIYRDFPDVQMIAEEATDWPGVTRPTVSGGLGFGMKWMMGWMHDTLHYFRTPPAQRPGLQDRLSFSMVYYYDENFMLPLSHDEVVHGKSPMIYKMPGDDWQKFANLRCLYTYMYTHPGAKLLFMGNEFGDTREWDYRTELQWGLLEYLPHQGLRKCVSDLNRLLRSEPALYQLQFKPEGFEWVDLDHRDEAVVAYRRSGTDREDDLLIVLNLKPEPRFDWRLRVRGKPYTKEIFNSDRPCYGGTGDVWNPEPQAVPVENLEGFYQINIHLPPLGAIVLR